MSQCELLLLMREMLDIMIEAGASCSFADLCRQAVVGPKLVFSFTVAQQLMSLFESRL